MTVSTLDGGNPRLPVYPLRVFRIQPGQSAILRMLSEQYFGLNTHWVKNRSYYCPGEECLAANHRIGTIWKGYASAEVYLQDLAKWGPVCLEISEHLELDFRHIYARGQVWELFRDPEVRKKSTPVIGKLLEERDPNTFPAALDLVPVLKHLYHVDRINVGVKNPLPERILVHYSEGEAPAILSRKAEAEKPMSDEQYREAMDRLKNRKSPQTKKPPLG